MGVGYYELFRDFSSNILISENTNNSCDQHFHRNIELLYVRKGNMDAVINGNCYSYNQDEIVFVPSYFTHKFSTPKYSDVLVLVIPFELLSDFNEFFKDKQLSPHLSDCKYNLMIRDVLELLLEIRANSNQFVLKGFVNIVFGLLVNHYPASYVRNNSGADIMIRILSYIEEHFTEDLSLKSIAETFNYNKYYVSHMFKKYVGENFKNYINTVRLQHIIESFNKTKEKNISSLAHRCGFNSMPSFYRCFHETYGMSPKEFFTQLKNNIEYNILDQTENSL